MYIPCNCTDLFDYKRPVNNKRVEFKPGEKERGLRGNKTPVNSTLSLFTGLLLRLDHIPFSPDLNSTLSLFTGLLLPLDSISFSPSLMQYLSRLV